MTHEDIDTLKVHHRHPKDVAAFICFKNFCFAYEDDLIIAKHDLSLADTLADYFVHMG